MQAECASSHQKPGIESLPGSCLNYASRLVISPFITDILKRPLLRYRATHGSPHQRAQLHVLSGVASMTIPSGWLLWALLSACFAALTAIFAKVGIRGVDSDLATLVRTAMILAVLGPFVWLTGKWSNPLSLSSKTLIFLALSALATGASWVCYFRALQLGPASQVAPIDKLSVVLVAVFAYLLLGERPSPQEWLGISLVAGGVLLIVLQKTPNAA